MFPCHSSIDTFSELIWILLSSEQAQNNTHYQVVALLQSFSDFQFQTMQLCSEIINRHSTKLTAGKICKQVNCSTQVLVLRNTLQDTSSRLVT